jgi:hypothetical protein
MTCPSTRAWQLLSLGRVPRPHRGNPSHGRPSRNPAAAVARDNTRTTHCRTPPPRSSLQRRCSRRP